MNRAASKVLTLIFAASLLPVVVAYGQAGHQNVTSGSITNSDPSMVARPSRNGITSECPATKTCPGSIGTSGFHYDAYTYVNTSSSTCVSIQLAPACGITTFVSAYLNSFDPANLCTNYLGDAGFSSATPTSFGVEVPGGATFVVVVAETGSGTGCSSYSLTISGGGANGLVRSDFNGDTISDIPLQNTTNGDIAIWQMNTSGINSGAGVSTPGVAWKVATTGDFNRDGYSDLIVQNSSTGDIALWEMNGYTVTSGAIVSSPGTAWKVVGSADFNVDGYSDLILQNSSTGQVVIWEMNRAAIIFGAAVATPGVAWKVVGAGDFNFDSSPDLMLQNSTTGDIAEWQLDGTTIVAGVVISSPGTSWKAIAVADIDGDSRADLLLQNSATGEVAVWLLNGFGITAGAVIGTPSGYVLYGAEQLSENGKSDLILRETATGNIAVWHVQNLALVGGTLLGSPGTAYVPIVK